MAVPNTFAAATSAIPLANLDANFAYYDAAYSISGTAVTFNGPLNVSAATSTISLTSTTGTNAAYQSFANTGGTYYIGIDSSTGATFTGTAYSLFRYAAVGRVIQDVIAGTGVITSASSTGLAVTGALSVTAGAAATPLALNTTNATTFVSSYTYNTSTILGYIGNGNGIIGSSASDFGMRSENDLILAAGGGTVRGRFSSAGLAVTGTLSNTTGANFATSSGNVGIGTSSPNYSLTSYKSGAVANYLQIVSGATGAAAGNGLLLGVDASGNSVINAQGAINLYTYVAGTLRTTINSSGNLGVGAAPVAGYYIYSPTIRSPKFYVDSTAWFDGAVGNTLGFYTSSSEKMRLDGSGNLGIGTSSPAYKLQVADNGNFNTSVNVSNTTAGASSYARFLAISSAGNASFGMTSTTYTDVTSAADALLINASGASGGMVFAHDGVGKMVLDSSGNLGLGVTPSAWGNGVSLQGSAWALSTTSGTDSGAFTVNARQTAYGTGAQNYVYRTTAPASSYEQTAGIHRWFAAPSGTAGNAIGFTQAMTLTAAGNLLVGTTSSDGSSLRVYGAYQTLGDGAYEGLIGKASSLVSGGGSGDFAVRSAANLVFATSGATERMRLDSSGNLGIGATANASAILDAQSTTKGVRMPNMTTTQKNAIASPAAGLMVFDTTLAKLCVYTGSAWQTITSS